MPEEDVLENTIDPIVDESLNQAKTFGSKFSITMFALLSFLQASIAYLQSMYPALMAAQPVINTLLKSVGPALIVACSGITIINKAITLVKIARLEHKLRKSFKEASKDLRPGLDKGKFSGKMLELMRDLEGSHSRYHSELKAKLVDRVKSLGLSLSDDNFDLNELHRQHPKLLDKACMQVFEEEYSNLKLLVNEASLSPFSRYLMLRKRLSPLVKARNDCIFKIGINAITAGTTFGLSFVPALSLATPVLIWGTKLLTDVATNYIAPRYIPFFFSVSNQRERVYRKEQANKVKQHSAEINRAFHIYLALPKLNSTTRSLYRDQFAELADRPNLNLVTRTLAQCMLDALTETPRRFIFFDQRNNVYTAFCEKVTAKMISLQQQLSQSGSNEFPGEFRRICEMFCPQVLMRQVALESSQRQHSVPHSVGSSLPTPSPSHFSPQPSQPSSPIIPPGGQAVSTQEGLVYAANGRQLLPRSTSDFRSARKSAEARKERYENRSQILQDLVWNDLSEIVLQTRIGEIVADRTTGERNWSGLEQNSHFQNYLDMSQTFSQRENAVAMAQKLILKMRKAIEKNPGSNSREVLKQLRKEILGDFMRDFSYTKYHDLTTKEIRPAAREI